MDIIRKTIESTTFKFNDNNIKITISIGSTIYKEGENIDNFPNFDSNLGNLRKIER